MVDEALADALPALLFYDTVYLIDGRAIHSGDAMECLRHPDGYHPLLDKKQHHKVVSLARLERYLENKGQSSLFADIVSSIRVLDELRVGGGMGNMLELGAFRGDYSYAVWRSDGSTSTMSAGKRFGAHFPQTRIIPNGELKQASTVCGPVYGAVVNGAAHRPQEERGGEEEELTDDEWHGIAAAHPSQEKRHVKACVDNTSGKVFLSDLSERIVEGKARARACQQGFSPAAAAAMMLVASSTGDPLPDEYPLASCSHRPLAPVLGKTLELARWVKMSEVPDWSEFQRRTGMAALWIFEAHPPQSASRKRRRSHEPAAVRLAYDGKDDLSIRYSSIVDPQKKFVRDEFLNCTGQPLMLRGDPRRLLRGDTGRRYFEGDLSNLLSSRAALVFVSRQSRREEHGGLFAVVDSTGTSLPSMASLSHSTQWVAYGVRLLRSGGREGGARVIWRPHQYGMFNVCVWL